MKHYSIIIIFEDGTVSHYEQNHRPSATDSEVLGQVFTDYARDESPYRLKNIISCTIIDNSYMG